MRITCGYVRRLSGESGGGCGGARRQSSEAVLRVAQNRPRLRALPSLYILIHLLQAIYLVGRVRRSLGRGRQIGPAPAITSIPTRDGEAVDSKCYSNRPLALPWHLRLPHIKQRGECSSASSNYAFIRRGVRAWRVHPPQCRGQSTTRWTSSN